MKIYTKTGDSGMTGLIGGGRVSKDSPRIQAYGEIDELNAVLGIATAVTPFEPIRKALGVVQETLFTVGAQLASPGGDPTFEVITAAHIDGLERQIDVMETQLSPLRSFILPGGSPTAAYLHLARTICRRGERSLVHLASLPGEKVDRWLMVYVNRLSDFLFVLARLANHLADCPDTPWHGKKK